MDTNEITNKVVDTRNDDKLQKPLLAQSYDEIILPSHNNKISMADKLQISLRSSFVSTSPTKGASTKGITTTTNVTATGTTNLKHETYINVPNRSLRNRSFNNLDKATSSRNSSGNKPYKPLFDTSYTEIEDQFNIDANYINEPISIDDILKDITVSDRNENKTRGLDIHAENDVYDNLRSSTTSAKDSPEYLLKLIQSIMPHFEIDTKDHDMNHPEVMTKLTFYALISLFVKNFILTWYKNKIQTLNDDFLKNLDDFYISKIYEFLFLNENLQKIDLMKFLFDDIPFIIENLTLMYKNNKNFKYDLKFTKYYISTNEKIESQLEKTFLKSLLNDFILGKILKNLLDPKVLLPILLMSATKKKDEKQQQQRDNKLKSKTPTKTTNFNQKNSKKSNKFQEHEDLLKKPQIRKRDLFRKQTPKSNNQTRQSFNHNNNNNFSTSNTYNNGKNSSFTNNQNEIDFHTHNNTMNKKKSDEKESITVNISAMKQDKQSILYRYIFNLVIVNLFRLDERKPLVYGFLKWLQYITMKYTDIDKYLYQYIVKKICTVFNDPAGILTKARHFLFPNDSDLFKPNNIDVDLNDVIFDCKSMFSDLSKKYKTNIILGISDDDIEDLIKKYLTSSLYLHNICLNAIDCFMASLDS